MQFSSTTPSSGSTPEAALWQVTDKVVVPRRLVHLHLMEVLSGIAIFSLMTFRVLVVLSVQAVMVTLCDEETNPLVIVPSMRSVRGHKASNALTPCYDQTVTLQRSLSTARSKP